MVEGRLIEAGRIEYPRALALLRGLAGIRRRRWDVGESQPETLILAEHPPVITLGRRTLDSDVLAPAGLLEQKGVSVHRIERGGLATIHGPGQVMIYPIVHLPSIKTGLAEFVRRLEESVILSLAEYGVQAGRREGHPGVWIGPKKIASIGLAVRRSVTIHGLALNVNTDLSFFDLINPCGLTSATMTSLADQTGGKKNLGDVGRRIAAAFSGLNKIRFTPSPLEAVEAEVMEHGTDEEKTGLA